MLTSKKPREMSKRFELMQGLNAQEKRACRAYVVLTHAFYAVGGGDSRFTNTVLNQRYEASDGYPKAQRAGREIEHACCEKWMNDAFSTGNRSLESSKSVKKPI